MTQVLSNFIQALRAADVRVSTAESIDAAATLHRIGFEQRDLVRVALSQVLAKSTEDKSRFFDCFDRFFTFEDVHDEQSDHSDTPPDANVGSAFGNGAGVGGGTGGLAELLESRDRAALQDALARAARNVQLQNIRLFTQRGMYTRRILEEMGIEAFDKELYPLLKADENDVRGLRLREQKARLVEDVSALVERQMLMYTANAWPTLRNEILQKTPLARIEIRDFKAMHELVRKLAQRLVSLHSRRRRVAKRGQLDVRRTIRRNIEYDGLLFDTVWKRVRIDRPKVIAVCDVSGSVAQVARFLLMFLYSVSDVLPKVRSFAFSNRLGEVTDLFRTKSVEEALAVTLNTYGMGSTDYGSALSELERLTANDIDQRTTVLILGDARSNYGDPGERALHRIHERAKRVLWLNPEPRAFWNLGDSAMHKLGACCDRVDSCRTLVHLERVVSEIARTAV